MSNNQKLRGLPSIERLCNRESQKQLAVRFGAGLVTYAAREVVDNARQRIAEGADALSPEALDIAIGDRIAVITGSSLRVIINATGVILHTNLGRAVLGRKVLAEMSDIVNGYSTVEFDLSSGKRGSRNDHVAGLLGYLTGAQDALVVNNNAAGIILALSTLAKKKEVIVSRGELIEIGGEFRIPDIMAASGAKMVEVGTTNRTRISDYEKAMTDKTALIFKAHKSNYSMKGFVQEASIEQCAMLAKKQGIPFVYDIGSGLIRKPASLPLESEPDVAGAVAMGADLVLFSCDKLLGGPQAGVVAGRAELVARCAKAPLMRALRCGKLTLAALASACRSFLTEESLKADNPTFAMLSRTAAEIRSCAEQLAAMFAKRAIACRIVESSGRCGGGTLPDLSIPSFALAIDLPVQKRGKKFDTARRVFEAMLGHWRPVLGIVREGELLLDMLTVDKNEHDGLAATVIEAVEAVRHNNL